jgi:hypothetical protein
VFESKVLKRQGAELNEDILETRRDAKEIARDMAYKRTAMLELIREHPTFFSPDVRPPQSPDPSVCGTS